MMLRRSEMNKVILGIELFTPSQVGGSPLQTPVVLVSSPPHILTAPSSVKPYPISHT